MRTKLLSLAFATWTVCAMQSQDTIANPEPTHPASFDKLRMTIPAPGTSHPAFDTRPITFPFWMVKAIALDLEEKSRLEEEVQLLGRELQAYKSLVTGLEEIGQRKALQLELMHRNVNLLELQLKAERARRPKDKFLHRGLGLLGALGVGFVMGRL